MGTRVRSVEWVCALGFAIAAASPAPADDEHRDRGTRAGLRGRLEGERNQPSPAARGDLRTITREQILALSLEERAKLIDGLQRGHTSGAEERLAAAILLATRGEDLTCLKDLIDLGGDRYDLEKLLFDDIDDAKLRRRILDHFAREAKPTGRTRVMSDVDDTLYANYKDRRYPKGTVYPGVLALQRELGGEQNHPVFITARPGDSGGTIEGRTHRDLREKGVGEATVLMGDLLSLFSASRMAAKKLDNFNRYRQLFPEYDYVWLGDSGQGDAAFGARALAEHPDSLRGALIHDVVGRTEATRARYRELGVRFFDTYVGAALHARELGLLDDDAVRRVAGAAAVEFQAIRFKSQKQEDAARAQLEHDLARVRALP